MRVFAPLIAVSGLIACGGATGPNDSAGTPTIVDIEVPAPYSQLTFAPLTVTYEVSSARGLRLVTVARQVFGLDGVPAAADTARPGGARSLRRSAQFPGITTTQLRPTSAQFTLHVEDRRGDARDSVFWVTFAGPPGVVGAVLRGDASETLVPGDSVSIIASASSAQPLTWLGYRIGPPVNQQDSVAVSGPSASHRFPVLVTAGWIQQYGFPITVFARNAIGDIGSGTTEATVLDAVRRPVTHIPLTAAVRDAVVDPKRNVLYLSQPDSDRILRLSLPTLTFDSPISIAKAPMGIDLSLSGDSLFVALRRSAAIGVVDLTTGTTTRIPMIVDANDGQGPENLRMAGNGLGIVTMTNDGGYGATGGIMELDPRFSTVLPRTDAGPMATLTVGSAIVRSADRSKVLVALNAPGSIRYDAASDAFTTANFGRYGTLSASANADRFLYGEMLYDGSLKLIRQVSAPIGGMTLLSADGLAVTFATSYGFFTLRAMDDSLLQKVVAAPMSGPMLLTPDGSRLISIAGTELTVVDLR